MTMKRVELTNIRINVFKVAKYIETLVLYYNFHYNRDGLNLSNFKRQNVYKLEEKKHKLLRNIS